MPSTRTLSFNPWKVRPRLRFPEAAVLFIPRRYAPGRSTSPRECLCAVAMTEAAAPFCPIRRQASSQTLLWIAVWLTRRSAVPISSPQVGDAPPKKNQFRHHRGYELRVDTVLLEIFFDLRLRSLVSNVILCPSTLFRKVATVICFSIFRLDCSCNRGVLGFARG